MEPEITIEPALTLRGFCEAVVTNHSAKWPPDESTIAEEFVSFFRMEKVLEFKDLERFCQQLEVGVSIRKLPREFGGHNHTYQGKREILIGTATEGALGSREHTLLHELRELIEHEFRAMGHPVVSDLSDREERAERFAGFVRAFAAIKSWQPLFDGIGAIKSGWGKLGMILLAAALVIVSSIHYLALPHWEDRLPRVKNP